MPRLLSALCLATLLLSACNNQYRPPPADGKPRSWGQQHYLDNQLYQEQTQDRMNLPE
jgi:hypothetical protein